MNAERTYELVYIIAPDATEEQVTDLHTQVETIVQKFSGRVDKTENWGRKRLAYEIARQKEGIYVLEQIIGPSDMVKELDRRLKVIDQVIRHLVIRVDEDMAVAERHRSERLAERARRRQARGLPPEIEPEADAPAPRPQDEDDEGESAQAEA
jgi:small subunit ribosomal protein S6